MLRRLFPGETSRLLPASFTALLALILLVATLGYLHSDPLLVAGVGALVILGGVAIAVAATRRVIRTENELEREKELAQVTLHSIGDGVITTDVAGRVDYINPVAEEYTGWGGWGSRARRLHHR